MPSLFQVPIRRAPRGGGRSIRPRRHRPALRLVVSFALALPLLAAITGFAPQAGAVSPDNQVQVNVSRTGTPPLRGSPR